MKVVICLKKNRLNEETPLLDRLSLKLIINIDSILMGVYIEKLFTVKMLDLGGMQMKEQQLSITSMIVHPLG
ncbi:MAG: hypothetical protein EOP48_20635 [Sphingobacteriales bacterium]|nr:MAG: hypothetical protein EOP48_20635 [Sphingobacteriales bacterium]